MTQRTVYVVPHTHWDREWYATFETFRGQLVQLWDDLLALTEADPDFRFLMDGQTVVIDDYLEVRPESRTRLDRAVRSGQIQVGPWYTLPDEFLVSGETLIRDLQRGVAAADAHGGSIRAGYLPDSFGHAAQMPQLYRQFGFRWAVVWRGVPLAIDRLAFMWEAPDGSRILTAYMGNSYSQGVDLPTEPEALATRITSALDAMQPFHPGADVLLMNGNDHVLPQGTLSAAVRGAFGRLNQTQVRLARLDDYLATLPETGWPVWRGELRSSARANVLMGTLSVRAADKQKYFDATLALERLAEPLTALAALDCRAVLESAWTLILQNAAHDTACGSGIDQVASESRQRSEAAEGLAKTIIDRCLPRLAGGGQVWNPSPFPRQGLVEVDGKLLQTPLINGYSVAPLPAGSADGSATASGKVLENEHLRCQLDDDGTFSVVDKSADIGYAGLHRLVDEADVGDEYTFSPPPTIRRLPGPVRNFTCAVREAGPLRARIEATFDYAVYDGLDADRQRQTEQQVNIPVRLTLTLETGASRLDVRCRLENRASDHRLRVHFPLPFRVQQSAADTAFNVTRRAVIAARRDPGATELELPTYPMWSFVDVSDGRIGLALVGHGLHEYEVLPGPPEELALTLLRCVGWLSRDDLATRIGHAGPAMETPGAQALGEHTFRYSLVFHRGDWETAGVWRAAERAVLPLVVGRGPVTTTVPQSIEVEPDCIQVTACTPRDRGFDLRILNASDRPREAVVRIQPEPRSVSRTSMDGRAGEPCTVTDRVARLELRPWEIATLAVTR